MSVPIEEQIREVVARIAHVDMTKIRNDMSFKDFEADSLDRVQIVIALEDKWQIELPEDEMLDIKNFGQFTQYVKSKLNGRVA